MSKSKLPPLDLKEDVEKYEAFSEQTEVSLKRCSHSQIKYTNGKLQCSCGVGYTGSRLNEIYELLTKKKNSTIV